MHFAIFSIQNLVEVVICLPFNDKSYTGDTSMHLVYVFLMNMVPFFLSMYYKAYFLKLYWYYSF